MLMGFMDGSEPHRGSQVSSIAGFIGKDADMIAPRTLGGCPEPKEVSHPTVRVSHERLRSRLGEFAVVS